MFSNSCSSCNNTLETHECKLIQQNQNSEPNQVRYFFAVNKEREQLAISFNWSGLQQEHENIPFFCMDTLNLSQVSIYFVTTYIMCASY